MAVTFNFKTKKITGNLGVNSFDGPLKQVPPFGVPHFIRHIPHQDLPINRATDQEDFQIVVDFID
jgi:hypothetical protein